MNTAFFARMHGGMTHFPIALVISSLALDLAAFAVPSLGQRRLGQRRDLRAAGFYASLLGALACFRAVLSGLLLTH